MKNHHHFSSHPHGEHAGSHEGDFHTHAGHGSHGRGEHRHHGGHGGHRRGGRRRGEVRIAVLLLLSEESMHGYQLMQTISERTDGVWAPSPGAIYPTLSQLEDEGLVVIDSTAGRKQVSLTDAGQAYVEEHREHWENPLVTSEGPSLRDLMHSLGEAVKQVGRTGTQAQREAAAKELTEVRRRLYLLLAE